MTPWTVACEAPLSVGLSPGKNWSGLPFSSPGDVPDPGMEPQSLALQEDSILKEVNPEYSSEGLMLELQYFGYRM